MARFSPSAWLYSTVPRSSQWPSIVTFTLALSRSSLASLSSAVRASARMVYESRSKNAGVKSLPCSVGGVGGGGVVSGGAGGGVGGGVSACWVGGGVVGAGGFLAQPTSGSPTSNRIRAVRYEIGSFMVFLLRRLAKSQIDRTRSIRRSPAVETRRGKSRSRRPYPAAEK